MESAPVENREGVGIDEQKEEIPASVSEEPREKKRIFFLTKSLAEVYAKQGHISSALEIYRRMREANPSDQEIERRMAELESRLPGKRHIRSNEQDK